MKVLNNRAAFSLVFLLLSSAYLANAQSQTNGFFTGGTAVVTRHEVVPELNSGMATVAFPAGVRTIWHSHAGGQIIVVTLGAAWYQEKGKAKRIVKQGEAVACPPNVMHWHGAMPGEPMTHVVATPNIDKGGATSGMPVTDQEYRGN